MNDLERYLDRVIGHRSANFPAPQVPMHIPDAPVPGDDTQPTLNVAGALLRRWYIVLITFVVLCSLGIPSIWLLIKRSYVVTGLIRVDPIISNIITGEKDSGGVSNYAAFMATQGMMVTGPKVVEKVATDLSNKGLQFFDERANRLAARIARKLGSIEMSPEPASILKEAILDGIITAEAVRNREVILVNMTWPDTTESKRIVDSFIRNYMTLEVTSASNEEERELAVLENEQKLLYTKLEDDRAQINNMAREFGSKKLAGRYDMNLERVGMLLTTLTKAEAERIYLESQLKLREQTGEESVVLEEWVTLRESYVNKDPGVQVRAANVVALEQELIVARQNLAPGNPKIKQKEELLAALTESLKKEKERAGDDFNKMMEKETASQSIKKLEDLKKSLEQARAHENKIKELLSTEDAQTIDLGQKNLAIQALQDELDFTKELYDTITRRTQTFKMERKRPARISVANYADISQVLDKRVKYTVALVFGAMAMGMLLAFLKEKADHSLRTPDDVVKRIGMRIIGTTTSTNTVKPARLREQVAGDYQTIRTNLGLLDGGGMPRKLVVTSPGMREGKTTFASNLAISTSKSGKKVLLIDGDLRNPNIAPMLGLPHGVRGLQDMLLGKALRESLMTVDGLDILAADSSNISDAFELLAASVTEQWLDEISRDYDHVIIDTPPVLAFADALIWAKVADGVVLTSFAGQTTGPNLMKAKQRLVQMNANVLGTVLGNVELDDSYQPYGYYYYARGRRSKARRAHKRMLLPVKPSNHRPKTP